MNPSQSFVTARAFVTARGARMCALMSITVAGCVSILLTGCSTTAAPEGTASSAPVEAALVVKQSPNDDRQYRYLVLDNQLRVLLVSDPTTDVAAASLNVLRGSMHDPEAYPGLAHFLEHMLFIGTEKYPQVDGYQEFVAAHGGRTNAGTGAENTNYFFEIQPQYFTEAMDRFSQFFISPLLDPAYVEREKNAVHSEYQLQIRDDGWRGLSAVKAAMNPDYPGSRFNIGNLETLGDGVSDALVEFFNSNYSADQMTLVAFSNVSLDELESSIRPMFEAIENRAIGPAAALPPAFDAAILPARLNYASLNERYSLSFNFPIPAPDAHYRTKPARYLTNLLGHEGEGSLHQLLKDRGWIESLGAGVSRLDHSNAFISINIDLTPAGRDATDEIGNLLFGYISILRNREPEAWRYEEQASVAGLSFEYQEKTSATSFVYRISPALALFPPQDVLVAGYLMEGFDAGLINEYLSYLTPENVLIEVSGPDVDTDQVERFFQVPYQLLPRIDDRPVAEQAGMHLPEPNPFLPDQLTLMPGDDAPPALVIEAPGRVIWLDEDVEFGVPRANQQYTLGVSGGLSTPESLVLARIYARLVTDALNHYAYPAMLAGLSYRIGVDTSGFRITLSGFSQKQSELLDRVLDEFASHRVDPRRFAAFKEELIREWRNFRFERPYTQTYAALNNLLINSSFDPETLAGALERLTVDDLEAWRRQSLASVSVVGFAHGNVNVDSAREAEALLDEHFELEGFPLTKPQLTIVDDWLLELPVEHDDASMVLYLQDEEASFESRARSALAAALLRQGYFSSLRTEQQLGYLVSMSNRTVRDRGALQFIIQSPVAAPAALEAATLTYMKPQAELVRAMDDATFEQYKAGLINQLTERPKNLQERTGRYLADLEADVTTFDSQVRIAAIVETLSQDDVADYLEQKYRELKSKRVLVYNLGKFEDAPERGKLPPEASTGD